MISLTRLFLVLAILGAPAIGRADVNSVTPLPSSRTLPVIGSASFAVTWVVNRTEPTVPGTVTVSSSNAVFNAGATTVNVGGLISQQSTLPPGGSGNVIFNETVVLSPELTQILATAPSGTVTLTRLFSDTQTTATGTINLTAGTGNAGPLAVRRIDLSFDDQSRTDVIHQGDKLQAIAEINYVGSGLLQGEWRVIEPASSLGFGAGRVIQVVRQQLFSSGQGRTLIRSPLLPTKNIGLYLVAFSVREAGNTIDTPVLRYFTLQKTPGVSPENLTVRTPAPGGSIDKSTVFSWPPVPGAAAYQIEIFEPGDSAVISGKLVPAQETSLTLSQFSLDGLNGTGPYDWRLRAIGADGSVIGLSPRHAFTLR